MTDVVYTLGDQKRPRHRVIVPRHELERVRDYGSLSMTHGVEVLAYPLGLQDGNETCLLKFDIPPKDRVLFAKRAGNGIVDDKVLESLQHVYGRWNCSRRIREIKGFDLYAFDGCEFAPLDTREFQSRQFDFLGSDSFCVPSSHYQDRIRSLTYPGQKILGSFHTHPGYAERIEPSVQDVVASFDRLQNGCNLSLTIEFIQNRTRIAVFSFSKHQADSHFDQDYVPECELKEWIGRMCNDIRLTPETSS
jgi:hypothetical protein